MLRRVNSNAVLCVICWPENQQTTRVVSTQTSLCWLTFAGANYVRYSYTFPCRQSIFVSPFFFRGLCGYWPAAVSRKVTVPWPLPAVTSLTQGSLYMYDMEEIAIRYLDQSYVTRKSKVGGFVYSSKRERERVLDVVSQTKIISSDCSWLYLNFFFYYFQMAPTFLFIVLAALVHFSLGKPNEIFYLFFITREFFVSILSRFARRTVMAFFFLF